MMFDLVIRGGRLVDGTGAPSRSGDLGIAEDRIAAIGDLSRAESRRSLDATGMVVAPGFMDIHSHSDFTLLIDPRAHSQIFQGVTTELVGNCGHGCAPVGPRVDAFTGNIYGYQDTHPIDWTTMEGYLARLEEAGPAVNVATLVPNGNLRLAAVGDMTRPATADETALMAQLLEEGLDSGAFGFSTGLEYPAEREASEEELIELCRVTARHGGLYATHERNREVFAIEAVDEGLRAAAATGVRLQVSHIIPRRGGPVGSLERCIELVEAAHESGLDVEFDAHTRLHGITNLSAVLPSWAMDDGPARLRRYLKDPAMRDRLKRYDSIISSFGLGGWDRVALFCSEGSPTKVGHSIAELTPAGGDPYDTLYDLLLAEGDDPHGALLIVESYDDDMLAHTFRHPLCTTESDATALCTDGPLGDTTFLGAYTWVGIFFRTMVRERRELTLEEAVYKLSAQPADRMRLGDRGRLIEGKKADIVVFDPDEFSDRGTLDDPNCPAVGVRHVLVNGGPTVIDGAETGHRSGRVLRR
ncbi:MAG: D-aminoacylase [Acidimicrobiia bacterium]|nr:D-aminoacylase [Acidimicrobiia bacterium]